MRTKVLYVVAGLILTLGVAEASLRILENRLPPSTHWPTVETDVKFDRLRELSEADVIFLGSSITEAGIDPIAFAEESKLDSAFNSGLPFSTPFSNEWWLNHVVLRHVEPKLVVIGLTAWSGGAGADDDLLLSGLESAIESAGEPSARSASACRRSFRVGLQSDRREGKGASDGSWSSDRLLRPVHRRVSTPRPAVERPAGDA